jgi:hypothetical protein
MAIIRSAFLAAALLTACSAPSGSDGAEAAIEAVMMTTWDRPEARLSVGPVVASGDWGVAGWTQGEAGGRALLRRIDGDWSVVLCAGDLLKTTDGLAQAGVPSADARRIADNLGTEEVGLAPERLAKMASFTGVVRMDAEH